MTKFKPQTLIQTILGHQRPILITLTKSTPSPYPQTPKFQPPYKPWTTKLKKSAVPNPNAPRQ